MTSLREALAEIPDAVIRDAEANGHEGVLGRTSAMLDYLEGLLAGADARLVTQAALDGIHGHVDQALTAVQNLANDPATYSANLDQAVENALDHAAPLVAATAGFAESVQKLGRRSGGLHRRLRRLEGEAEAMENELRDLEDPAPGRTRRGDPPAGWRRAAVGVAATRQRTVLRLLI